MTTLPVSFYLPPIPPPADAEAEKAKKRAEARARRYVTRRARDTDDRAQLLACLGLEDGDE